MPTNSTQSPSAPDLARGSEWRKWDLHVHSPASGLNNQFPKLPGGDPDWESYVKKLEGLTDVAVLGITDYFSIDGYRKLQAYTEDFIHEWCP
jgi:predicted metal-dependent phosphoesterase TrpH